MPQGVEHVKSWEAHKQVVKLLSVPMPQGVEHVFTTVAKVRQGRDRHGFMRTVSGRALARTSWRFSKCGLSTRNEQVLHEFA